MVTLIYQTADGQLDSLAIDATITQTHGSEVDITQHPVEVGVKVTDHVRLKPQTLRLDCVFSDFPLGAKSSGVVGAKGRAAEAYRLLERLQVEAVLIEVRAALKSYERLLIQSLTAPVTKETGGGGVKFSANLQTIRFVDSQVLPVKFTALRAAGKDKGGKKTGENATDRERSKSFLVQIVDKGSQLVDSFMKAPVR